MSQQSATRRFITFAEDDPGGFSEAEIRQCYIDLTGRALTVKDETYLGRLVELQFSTQTTITLMNVVASRAQKTPGSMRFFFVSLNELSKLCLDSMINELRGESEPESVSAFFRALVEVRRVISMWCANRFAPFHEFAFQQQSRSEQRKEVRN